MIKRASISDAKGIYEIYFQPSVQPFMVFEKMPFGQFKRELEKIFLQKEVYVYKKGEKIIGYGAVSIGTGMERHMAEISMFAVHPEWQGTGIGKKILGFLISKARKRKATRIQLMVESDNPKAIRLYSKFGFAKEGLLRHFMKRSNGYIDDFVMAKLF